MGRQIEILGGEDVHNDMQGVGPHEHAAEHGLLGFGAVRRHAPQQIRLGVAAAASPAGKGTAATGSGAGGGAIVG